MMAPSGCIVLCFLLSCVWLVSSWSSSNVDGVGGSDLLPKSLWAEELSLSLLPSYYSSPDLSKDPDVCIQLLHEFANSSAALSGCLVKYARPVRICQGCHTEYVYLKAVMDKITSQKYPLNSTYSCALSLLQSDRVHMLVSLNDFFDYTWDDCKCESCLQNNNTEVRDTTIEFMGLYKELNTCFIQNMQNMEDPPFQIPEGNYSKVCQNCNESYRSLNTKYSSLENSKALCIDLEDAMNGTRILWSKTFNCTVPCTDTVPVIAVSAFILFLPFIFYLSTFLHSEQKKLKLVLPKRFASSASLAHIQDLNN
ncbi:osteopetrosis-associated transmembrane 1 [Pelobates cultripes]|uniref:Osteopetrosis-associated transmembrane 1 n=1 Tax=Pelobates cultripes TaxID=61616 RepID=A0AAD1RFU6_PELCU|nr:osteopetrosis-associated transmembrane 1 [Pelobates cultripes]